MSFYRGREGVCIILILKEIFGIFLGDFNFKVEGCFFRLEEVEVELGLYDSFCKFIGFRGMFYIFRIYSLVYFVIF